MPHYTTLRNSVPALLLTTLLTSPVFAQNAEEEEAVELGTIVLSATAGTTNLRDAPASVTVIPAEELAKMPGTDLNDTLRRIPGVSLGATPDGGTSAQIRGLPQGYTLILVDGRRMGSSSDTYDRYSRNEINWIPKDSIETIEVVRGPMSSLYGSDAMGGVINIITKKADDTWSGSITTGAEINADSIRGNDYTVGFTLSGPLTETLKLRISGQYLNREGDKGLPDGRTAFRWAGGREGSKIASGGIGLDWDAAPGHRLSFDYDFGNWRSLPAPEGDTSNPGNFTSAAFTRGPAKMTRENFALGYTGEHSFGTSRLSLTHSEYRNKTDAPLVQNGALVPQLDANGNPVFDRRGNPVYQTYDTDAVAKDLVLDGSVTLPFTWGYAHELTLGAQWLRSELDNANSVGSQPSPGQVLGDSYAKTSSFALFAEDQITLSEDLTLTLGLRADKHDDFGSRLSPRAYLVYHLNEEWTLRGGYSTGFRAPTLRQTNPNFVGQSMGAGCVPGAPAGHSCFTRGNPDLKAETTKNFEIGAAWERGGWSAGITAFHTDFSNKIQERGIGVIGAPGIYWQEYFNVSEATTAGIEANFRVPLIEDGTSGWAENLTWSTSATWMAKAKDTQTGEPLSATPKWSLATALDWQVNEGLDLSLQGTFTGKQVHLDWRDANNSFQFGSQRIAKSYMIFDIAGSYKLHENAQLNLGIKNIFDRDPNGDIDNGNNFYTPGRRAFVSLTTRF